MGDKQNHAAGGARAKAGVLPRIVRLVAAGVVVGAAMLPWPAAPFGALARASVNRDAVPLLDTTPWLASVQAPKTPFFERQADAEHVSFRFTNSGRYLAKGNRVIVAESPEGDMWMDGMVYATYIDRQGEATSGWLVRSHLKPAAGPARASGWDGDWRSSDGARKLIVHGERVSYSFGGAAATTRMEMLLMMKSVSDVDATLLRPQASGAACDLDVRRLDDYLVVAARDCFIRGANPGGILRRMR
ncbi:hypothetical protein [Burkholderia singularis]|uniref:Putative membrane protein n=1 Tax=Burkholderia singularis TaxID=1503053 RepID=A0A238GYS4_9BURK|nr:hypothetical protein [Burkholderia singularis]SMF98127.1 putative membrane protein [Burkholderia singularis]